MESCIRSIAISHYKLPPDRVESFTNPTTGSRIHSRVDVSENVESMTSFLPGPASRRLKKGGWLAHGHTARRLHLETAKENGLCHFQKCSCPSAAASRAERSGAK